MKATRFSVFLIGFTLLLFCGFNSYAADFYVSAAGNDSWDGTAAEYKGGNRGPWLTLGKVNQQMAMLEGGTVLFRCGDQFEGMLEIKGKNLRFGAYGEGERPVLSGARFPDGQWSPVDGRTKVYEKALPSDVNEVTLLLRENVSLPLGRTPNGDLMTNAAFYDFSSRTLTSVNDPELSDAEGLAGAEIVLRQNVWTYSAYQITTIEGSTINFLNERPRGIREDEAGYFFQKHIETLDVDGEWFFDEKNHTLYLYSDTSPGSKNFQYSANPVVIKIDNAGDIALKGLRIEMAALTGIAITGSQQIEIEDCEIALCGQEGITVTASSAHIERNLISDCFSYGIRTTDEGRVVITGNRVTNIGMIPGRGSGRNGISLRGGNSEASYNRLSNIGYIGIHHTHGRNLIRRNVFDGYNLVAFDGGAIYTHGNQKGSVVEENIIMNGMPGFVGLGGEMADMEVAFATGIQLDKGTEDLIVRNNTISFPQIEDVPDRGIHLNALSRNNIIKGNTILVRGAGITTLERLIRNVNHEEVGMSGNMFEENIIVSTATSNKRPNYGALTAFSLKDTDLCDVERQGEFRNNVCAFPFKRDKIINEYQLNCNPDGTHSDSWFDSATEWNDAREYASGNLDSPVRIDESSAPEDFIQLLYNDSDNPKTFPLSKGDFLDPRGNPVTGSVTVAPWRSIVLFKNTGDQRTTTLIIGTYTRATSEGIYKADFDNTTGELSNLQAIARVEQPSFLALSRNKEKIYTISEIAQGKLSVFEKQEDGRYSLDQEISTEGSIACHVILNEDESLVAVANYGSGSFILYDIQEGKLSKVASFNHEGSGLHPDRQRTPHPHSSYFSEDEKYIYVADLGTDEIVSYQITDGKPAAVKVALKMEPGDGPRHMAPHPAKNLWFVVGELSSVVWSLRAKDDGTFEVVDKQSLLPSHVNGNSSAADVHVSPDGMYLYASNRGHRGGHHSIAIFKIEDSGKLQPLGHATEGVNQPRNFCLSPDGKFLLVANQNGNNIIVFEVNQDGMLKPTGHSMDVSMPVCLIF